MSLIVLTATVAPFGFWLALEGLWLRLFSAPLAASGPLALWQRLAEWLALPLAEFGWPMIVVGAAWLSVLSGLWMRLGWSRRTGLTLALASLLHLGIGTAIGVVALACLADRRLASWLKISPG